MKQNLVLVNSFYGNSILLKGLIDFLDDHFRVFFIDLPGFSRDVPPLDEISLDGFSRNVAGRIAGLGLDSYILGGLSFGFHIACRIRPDAGCKGIAAVIPYVNARSLKLRFSKRMFYRLATGAAVGLNVSQRVWRSRAFNRLAHWYSVYPGERVDVILDQMEGRTFFETGRIILKNREAVPLHDLPTALILSRSDGTIDNPYILELFRSQVSRLLVVETDMDHYPERVDKAYFAESFGNGAMDRILRFYENPESFSRSGSE
jgi:pimeloyl-ACP methyl ester carboxylesterase